MPYTILKTPGDGHTTDFPISFEYLSRDHVSVYLNGAITYEWSWVNDSMIRLNTAPPNGVVVTRQRRTSPNARLVSFNAPSSLNEVDLEVDSFQGFALAQEAVDISSVQDETSNEATALATEALEKATAVEAFVNTEFLTTAAKADAAYALATSVAGITGTIVLTSSNVNNASGVSGAKITDALNTLKGQVDGLASQATDVAKSGKLLTSGTAVNQSGVTINLSSYLTAGYKRFTLALSNLRPQVDGQTIILVASTNGGTSFLSGGWRDAYDTTGQDYWEGFSSGVGTDTYYVLLATISNGAGNESWTDIHFRAGAPRFLIETIGMAYYSEGFGVGKVETVGDLQQNVNAVRIVPSSGLIATMSWSLYGVPV